MCKTRLVRALNSRESSEAQLMDVQHFTLCADFHPLWHGHTRRQYAPIKKNRTQNGEETSPGEAGEVLRELGQQGPADGSVAFVPVDGSFCILVYW